MKIKKKSTKIGMSEQTVEIAQRGRSPDKPGKQCERSRVKSPKKAGKKKATLADRDDFGLLRVASAGTFKLKIDQLQPDEVPQPDTAR